MTAMDISIDAFLADSAETVQGKIYALGVGWNGVQISQFPARHARMSVGIVVEVPYTETNRMHRIALCLEDEDNDRVKLGDGPQHDAAETDVYELGGQFSVGRPPLLPAGDSQVVPLTITIDGLIFHKPGMYHWVIRVNDEEKRRLPMRVVQVLHAEPRG